MQSAPLFEIDPARDLPLARAFRAAPWGPHSADLMRLLNRLRWEPMDDKFVLVSRERNRSWVIGKLEGGRGSPVRLLDDEVFTSREAAEWAVFKRRWTKATGQALAID